ncbi:hypothetical protein FB639_003819, partial [Coemansia asiatica]
WVTRAVDMNLKYKAMCNVVRTHALVSMGISTYSHRHKRPGSYNVNNFNFTLQQQNSHLVNSASLGFLAGNGYDLNKQAVSGIRYFSGPNPEVPLVGTREINEEGWLMRQLFLEIVRVRVPLIVHNGLYDLLYIYQAFFGPLPDTYTSFVHDLWEMFPGGIYDTKYIVEMNEPESASFLAYLYHKHERKQIQRLEDDEPAVCIKIKDRIKYRPMDMEEEKQERLRADSSANSPFCEQFAAHGHCRFKERCSKSHDINFILDCQSKPKTGSESGNSDKQVKKGNTSSNANNNSNKSNGNGNSKSNGNGNKDKDKDKDKGRNNKRKREDDSEDLKKSLCAMIARIVQAWDKKGDLQAIETSEETSSTDSADAKSLGSMYHTAAYDAFMTGFIFASYKILLGEEMDEFKNKVFLMGKPEPLLIKGSNYSTSSMTYKQTEKFIIQQPIQELIASASKQEDSGKQSVSNKKAKTADSKQGDRDHHSDNGYDSDENKNNSADTEDPTQSATGKTQATTGTATTTNTAVNNATAIA